MNSLMLRTVMKVGSFTDNVPLDASQEEQGKPEMQNARALVVLARVKDKLTGRDFKPDFALLVPDQVDKLLQQATSLEVRQSFSNTFPSLGLTFCAEFVPIICRMVRILVNILKQCS